MAAGAGQAAMEGRGPAVSQTPKTALAEGAENGLAGVAPASVATPTVVDLSSVLPVGAFRTSDHRYYFNGQGPVPGVTSVLEVMSKPALITWKAKETGRAIYRMMLEPQRWEGMGPEVDEEQAILWALKAADQSRDKAAKLGSSIHLLADMASRASESDSAGFTVSDEEFPYLTAWKGFLAFLEAQGGRIISSEHMIWSLNGYGGTYDLIVEMAEELWMLDIKTSKGYYPEYGLQLAAYRWADSIIVEGTPTAYPMPEIQRAGVLHLRPDQYPDTGWRLVEYPITYEKDYMAFLGCLEVYRWRQEDRFSKSNLNRYQKQKPVSP